MYEHTVNSVTLKEEQDIVMFCFNTMQQSLLWHKTGVKGILSRPKLVDQSGVLASLIVLEIHLFRKQLKPPGLPSKRK